MAKGIKGGQKQEANRRVEKLTNKKDLSIRDESRKQSTGCHQEIYKPHHMHASMSLILKKQRQHSKGLDNNTAVCEYQPRFTYHEIK